MGSHLVELYEDEEILAETVAEFLAPALGGGGVAVIVATPEHRRSFTVALCAADLDVAAARRAGRLVELDARETLSRFMVDTSPDPGLFEEVIGGLLATMPAMSGDLFVYGEMVALLWDDGNGAAAIALEDLWNDLAARHRFSLLCGYPASAFVCDEATADFLRICEQHSGVIPAESLSALDPDLQHRSVTRLQQQAAAARTEREELRQALERVRELERLRSEFLAMVVHDIRGPLAVTAGYLDLLKQRRDQIAPERIDEFIANGLQAARRIEHLVNDMLTATSLEACEFSYHLRVLDLGALVESVVEQFAGATGANVEVTITPSLPPVVADSDRQAQILENLLTNAVRFSAPGSPVWVVVGRAPDGMLRVSVTDRGVGFDMSEANKLFSPFGRVRDKASGAGTGLGLYIAKALVEGQGGSITATSIRDHGSTFSYTVPAAYS
jgi:signal transduction histidine kinase